MWYCYDEGDGFGEGFDERFDLEEDVPSVTEVSTQGSCSSVASFSSEATPNNDDIKPTKPKRLASGYVPAKNVVRVRGLPTDATMSKHVHSLPEGVGKMFLTAGVAPSLLPVAETGHVIKVFAQRDEHSKKPSFFHRRGGTTTLMGSDGKPFAGGIVIQEYRRLGTRPSMVLQDCDGKALAMCRLEDRHLGLRAYQIYGTQPLRAGRNSKGKKTGAVSAPRVKECGVFFYPWFRYEEKRKSTDASRRFSPKSKDEERPFRSILVWNGSGEFEPMWRAYPIREAAPAKRRTFGEEENKEFVDNDRILNVTDETAKVTYGTLVKYLHVGCQVTIAPGVDPALILCLAAIQDDSYRDVE